MSGQPECKGALAEMVAAVGERDVLIWKENAATVEVFNAMLTQWNVGPGGVIGLRYEALPALLDMSRAPAADRHTIFTGLRIMERAALEQFSHG